MWEGEKERVYENNREDLQVVRRRGRGFWWLRFGSEEVGIEKVE